MTVVDPSGTPTLSPSSSGGDSGGGGGYGDGGTSSEPTPEPSTTPGAETREGGIVVSGITAHAHGQLNPFGGAVVTSVSVINNTKADVSGTIAFHLVTLFGTQIGPTMTQDVVSVPPDQSHASSVDLPDVGQWPLVKVTAEFTTTPASGSVPIEREAWVLAFPWLLLVILVLAIALVVILRLARPDVFGRGRSGP